jgi:PKD repeat protein
MTKGKPHHLKRLLPLKSLLSIQLNIRPQVVKRGDKVIFSATAPNAKIYEWTVGSKDTAVTETGRFISSFDVSGTYPLTLKVTDRDENTNTIQRKVYVVDGDKPFAVAQMSTKSLFTEIQPDACDGKEALIADRVTPVSLIGDKSVNVGGKTTDLTYFWKVGLNASSTQKNFSHTFDELGCEEISLTVTDKKTGASHTSKEWVKVVNIPPRFSDIDVKVENIDQDPMRINLRMEGAKDPDGVIRSYTWYYYTSTDEQPQGFRITTKPETSFTLPKINGRYYFSVVLEDANGLRVDTRDISENKFSTPDLLVNQNISTPIIEFKASTTDAKYGDPVELTVTAKNALGQDITKVVEYRWDVDGDGFYDIKTSENVLSYKYTVPGEYHPKVKATHRGLSTTKFITINVTNRLIPQAQIQVIGDKIIAYNTSTGIVQSVSWFADNVKVSENKEYLLFTPNAGSFPKNIRLEISDGIDKQSVTIPVERNPQNKVLVRKANRPLVVLTNENNTVAPVGDDVIWSDPVKPLFFYLGESEWAIQYYVIDNDVDVDTDLSGGKNDDADNRGTASYRLGRPYLVPLGTKRVTIMKFRLLGSDGKELDSRQIRVTRSFMAQVTDANNITGVTPGKTTQTFNLSKEDKARLDRLTVLVKNVSDEATKKDLLRYVDQLGDIWYDRADRAETLLQFSRAVNDSDVVNADLKTRILEQINLIYTQGQQDAEEKDLARTMLADFLQRAQIKKKYLEMGLLKILDYSDRLLIVLNTTSRTRNL